VLEGIALTGDPNFDILESAFPWVLNHTLHEAKQGRLGADALTAGRLALEAIASPERAAGKLAAQLQARPTAQPSL